MFNEEWAAIRNRLLFKSTPGSFPRENAKVRASYLKEYRKADEERRKEIIRLISNITADLSSYLLKWNLQSHDRKRKLWYDEALKQVDENCKMLAALGAEQQVDEIRNEIGNIKKSNLYKLSNMNDAGLTNTRWGNDSGSGLMQVMRKGAMLVTTNPVIVNIERKNNGLLWDGVREFIRKENPDADPRKLATQFTMHVVLQNCFELRPIFEASDGKYGYVSYQVDPYNSKDADKMEQEIEYIYGELKRRLKGTPNVVFKVPGTKQSLKVVERVTRKGIGVNITCSYSVAQHQAFAEVIERGSAKCSFVVMMSGRLDDPIREDLVKAGVENADAVSRSGSAAVIRKSYATIYAGGKFRKSAILVASLRGPWNIDASITDKKAPIFVSVFPNKRDEYDAQDRVIKSAIEEKIPRETIDKLMQSDNFKKAYEVSELPIDAFDDYYPVVATLDSFKKEFDEIQAYMSMS